MKINCEKCGCQLSKKDIKICSQESDFPVRYICEECFLIEEDCPVYEETFDSDSGL